MNRSRMRTSLILLVMSLITLKGAYATDNETYIEDENIEAGRVVSTRCAICHGQDGEGNGAPKSKISGMDVDKFIKIIHEYQSGIRKNVMMHRFTELLTDKDIADVAVYYASK